MVKNKLLGRGLFFLQKEKASEKSVYKPGVRETVRVKAKGSRGLASQTSLDALSVVPNNMITAIARIAKLAPNNKALGKGPVNFPEAA